MAEEKSPALIPIKDAAVMIPLMGSVLALCWVEGSFLPIGIQGFSYFSLAEHLTFAIPALPVAFVVAGTIYFAMTIFGSTLDALGGREISASHLSTVVKWFAALLTLVSTLFAKYGPSAAMFALASSSAFAFLTQLVEDRRLRRALIAAGIVISLLLLATGLGVDLMRVRLNEGKQAKIETTRGNLNAVIVRSGERGLLLYDRTKQDFMFLKWEAIQSTEWHREGPVWLR